MTSDFFCHHIHPDFVTRYNHCYHSSRFCGIKGVRLFVFLRLRLLHGLAEDDFFLLQIPRLENCQVTLASCFSYRSIFHGSLFFISMRRRSFFSQCCSAQLKILLAPTVGALHTFLAHLVSTVLVHNGLFGAPGHHGYLLFAWAWIFAIDLAHHFSTPHLLLMACLSGIRHCGFASHCFVFLSLHCFLRIGLAFQHLGLSSFFRAINKISIVIGTASCFACSGGPASLLAATWALCQPRLL